MRSFALAALIVLTAVAASCSSVGFDRCAPGQQSSCSCEDGRAGAQTCNDDGSAYAPCVCSSPGASSAEAASSSTGGGAASSSSASASSSSSAGGATFCAPASTEPCYPGPADTLEVGACHAGLATCAADGSSFGPCAGFVLPAIEDCATPADDECTGALAPCGADTLWALRFGDDADQAVHSVTVDDAGDVLIGGYFKGTIDLGGGPMTASSGGSDLVVAKLSPAGSFAWANHVGAWTLDPIVAADGSGNVIVGAGLAGTVDFGGGVVPGSDMLSDATVAKLDPDGKPLWVKRWPEPIESNWIYALSVSRTHDIYVAGRMGKSIDVGCGAVVPPSNIPYGAFLAKLAPDGTCVWSTAFGGEVYLGGLAPDESGALYVAGGVLSGDSDLGGGLMNANTGQTFFVKLAPDGSHVFSKLWSPRVIVNAMARDASDRFFVTGAIGFGNGTSIDFGNGPLTTNGNDSAFLLALDASATALWSRVAGPDSTEGQAIALDPSGNVVTTGHLVGNADFGTGILTTANGGYVARYDPASGAALAATVFDGTPNLRVAVDGHDHVVLAGALAGQATFPSGTLISAGANDGFIADTGP